MIGKTPVRICNMSLCYNVSKINIIEVIEILNVFEVLPILLKIEKKIILLLIVYHILCPLGSFIDDFISLINELPRQQKMLIVGDFNLEQMLPEHVVKVDPLIQNLTCLSVHNTQLIQMGEYWI